MADITNLAEQWTTAVTALGYVDCSAAGKQGNLDNPATIADFSAAITSSKSADQQEILEAIDLESRLASLNSLLDLFALQSS